MYRTIDVKLWNDPKVRKLAPIGKLVFVYLVTNPHAHLSGIYHLPRPTVIYELGIKNPELDRVYDTLSRLGMAGFDMENDVVWVKNMLHYQGKGEKHYRSAAYHLEDLHNSILIKDFLEKYPQIKEFVRIPHMIPLPEKSHQDIPGPGPDTSSDGGFKGGERNGHDVFPGLGYCPDLIPVAKRILDVYRKEVCSENRQAGNVALNSIVEILWRKTCNEEELSRACRRWASHAKKTYDDPKMRHSAKTFFSEGHWQDWLKDEQSAESSFMKEVLGGRPCK
jgi:hypothetical protein